MFQQFSNNVLLSSIWAVLLTLKYVVFDTYISITMIISESLRFSCQLRRLGETDRYNKILFFDENILTVLRIHENNVLTQ